MYLVDVEYESEFYASLDFERYFGSVSIGIFDIETTGLDPKNTKFVLGGLLTPVCDDMGFTGKMRVRQFFSEGGDEEAEELDMYKEALGECDVLISYNGNNFDIPFLNARLAKHHRKPLSAHISLDMYRIIDRHTDFRTFLPNLRQKTVEDFLGLWSSREDRISGRDSVYLYHEYVATKQEELRGFILLHNRDDLMQLGRILIALDRVDMDKVVYETGFPVIAEGDKIFVKNINLSRNMLLVKGVHTMFDHERRHYKGGIELRFDENGTFSIDIPCMNEGRSIYTDAADVDVLGRIGDYLVLRDNDEIDYRAMNELIKALLVTIIDKKEVS